MKYLAFGTTHPGIKRTINEDAMLVDRELGLMVIADGRSDNGTGQQVAQLAIKTIHSMLKEDAYLIEEYDQAPGFDNRQKVLQIMRAAVEASCRDIHAKSMTDSEIRGGSTTVVVMILAGDSALIAHVGDSRAYLCRDGQMFQVTDDHSLMAEQLRKGLILPDEVVKGPVLNVLTKTIGLTETVEVETVYIELATSDTLLLCSDGVSMSFTNKELGKLLQAQTLERTPEALINAANKRGGRDNATAIVIHIGTLNNSEGRLTPGDKIEALRRLPVFQKLTYRDLLKVLSVARLCEFRPEEYVIRQGEPSGAMFVSMRGRVRVVRSGTTVAELPPGSCIGEMSVVDNVPRSADIAAIDQVSLMEIRQRDLMVLLRQNPHLAVRFLSALCQVLNGRLRTTTDDLAAARASIQEPVHPPSKIAEDRDPLI